MKLKPSCLYSSSFSLIGAKRSLQSHKHQSKESEGIMAAASLSRIHLFVQQPSSNQWKREEKNESVLVSTVNSCSTSKSLSRSRFLYNRAYEIWRLLAARKPRLELHLRLFHCFLLNSENDSPLHGQPSFSFFVVDREESFFACCVAAFKEKKEIGGQGFAIGMRFRNFFILCPKFR